MNTHSKKYAKQAIISIILTIIVIIAAGILLHYYLPFLKHQNGIFIYLKPANVDIKNITADSSNRFILKAEVKDGFGEAVSGVSVNFTVDNNIGILNLDSARTNKFGEIIVTYIPPDTLPLDTLPEKKNKGSESLINNVKITVTASVSNRLSILDRFITNSGTASIGNEKDIDTSNESKSAKCVFELIQVPIVLVHGYQSTSDIFSNMASYLDNLGFDIISFDYNSLEGVIPGANKLKEFLKDQTQKSLLKGIQLERFDIVSHSMGGVISRFYSVQEDYIEYGNIRKLIFISTPHKGSHLAPIGAEYFNDRGVKDMMPESDLYKKTFPQMINKGLNPGIQTGNIIGQYDEVVSIESASLHEWEIDTRIFNLGDNKFNVDNLLDGTISQNAIHKVILNNKKIYETIVDMLTGTLKYPAKIK